MCMHLCILCVYIKLNHVCIKLGMYRSLNSFNTFCLLACLHVVLILLVMSCLLVAIYSHITKTCPCNIQRIFENFLLKNLDIFLIFAQNIDCGFTLEPPRRGGSNEYPQSMFWSKNKKNRFTPANPSFSI